MQTNDAQTYIEGGTDAEDAAVLLEAELPESVRSLLSESKADGDFGRLVDSLSRHHQWDTGRACDLVNRLMKAHGVEGTGFIPRERPLLPR